MFWLVTLAAIILASTAVLSHGPIFATVLSCYDGDTCILREILPGRDRVRLSNADTPEIEGRCQSEIERALMARDYTRSMVVGRIVTLTAVEPDKYRKRIDAYVSIDGRDLGEALIAAGLARPVLRRQSPRLALSSRTAVEDRHDLQA
jgi:endonuclease YncB( thermonuclease family)